MIRKFLLLFSLSAAALNVSAQQSRQETFTTAEMSFSGAWYIQKVPLNSAATPDIRVSDQDYSAVTGVALPDSLLQQAVKPLVRIGFERKKPFAIVCIPAYRKDDGGNWQKLEHFSLNITEQETAKATGSNTRTMRRTAPASVLANGSWHKIAVPARGVYKVDYAFIKNNLGTASVSSSAIRLFGNGGTLIEENNNLPRHDDLVENALEMHDGGDGNFNEGDYFLFYANGPMDWTKDSSKQLFYHRTNLYADSSYYFITLDNGTGLRIQNASEPGSPTTSVNSFNDYALHEKELRNLGQFGKTWWGETFGFTGGLESVQTFNFPVNNLIDTVHFRYNLASAAIPAVANAAAFRVKLNGVTIGEHNSIYGIPGTDGSDVGVPVYHTGVIPASGSNLAFTIQYFKYTSDAKAYLDYIEVNMRRRLALSAGQQLSFRDWRSIGPAAVARYSIDHAGPAVQVWDVTDPLRPQKVNGSLSGTTYSFNQHADMLHEFIATDGNYLSAVYAGKVANQNLHGLAQQDYVIIAHEDYMDAANKLADFHRNNGLKVVAVPVGQIYNEFGSGAKDISALRDFMRMFYDRAGDNEHLLPKHLLLFGQASYDYKNIIPNNARIVPTYETPESLWSTVGYCSDDFFAILDSTEFIDTGNALLDIGIGRLPATTVAEANAMADKIIRYKSPQALGPWRLNNIYAGDMEDGAGDHLLDADSMSKAVNNSSPIYNALKVYLDNMNIISTPGGQRSPDANKAINDNIYKGSFLFNYSGHGSIYTLSSKRILTQDDFKSWKNTYKMPIMITATCDFSRFDNPALQSAGEKLINKGDGGAIALVTTTQVVYALPNQRFNSAYLRVQFTKKDAGGWHSFGDAFRIAKNSVLDVTGLNSRKFALLGDPALIPDFPRYNVVTDTIREVTDAGLITADSVKSLGTYLISGSVRDDDGAVMNNFNGKVNISFYDKPQTVSVRTANSGAANRKYSVQNNLIYKGIATVQNGRFSFTFITPKDINYDFGKGRISYYADNGTTDAAGADGSVTVGGFSDNATTDNDAPVVRPFMNDSLFRDGAITGPNSVLYAIITDESGINISGNAVGHDLTAVLDGMVEIPYVLNDYYETAPNTYKRGYVNFPMTGLSNGKHTLRVKAWDVFNNSGEGTIRFEVIDGSVVSVQHLYNYPNPFRDMTHFVFEHNHPNESLKATIHIFNTAGSLVTTLEQHFTPTGSKTAELTWDGTDNSGAKLPAGVYPYRIRIATETNIEDLGYEKVVLIR